MQLCNYKYTRGNITIINILNFFVIGQIHFVWFKPL